MSATPPDNCHFHLFRPTMTTAAPKHHTILTTKAKVIDGELKLTKYAYSVYGAVFFIFPDHSGKQNISGKAARLLHARSG